jgi:hypothetical protein
MMKRAWLTNHKSSCLLSPCELHEHKGINIELVLKMIEEQNISNKINE